MKKRSPKGKGSLKKRGKVYYLIHTVNGKKASVRLLDENSNPCTTVKAAEKARDLFLAPLAIKDKADRLTATVALLKSAEDEVKELEEAAIPALPITQAFREYDRLRRRKAGPRGRLLTPSENQIQRQRAWLNAFRTWLGDHHPNIRNMHEVTEDIAFEYFDSLTEDGCSTGTYNKKRDFLRTLYFILQGVGRIEVNPFADILRQEDIPESRRVLTLEELKEVIQTAEGELKTLFLLGLFTGMRLGDCCTLKWSEVDLAKGIITRIPSKTAKRKKKVVVRSGIPRLLHDELTVLTGKGKSGFVFVELSERYLSDQPKLSKEIKAHFESCGIHTVREGSGKGTGKRAVVEVGFHSLRHTHVTLHAEAGTPLAFIQKKVGHANPAMTLHYAHESDTQAIKMANTLSDVFGGVKPAYEMSDEVRKMLGEMKAKTWKQIRDRLLA